MNGIYFIIICFVFNFIILVEVIIGVILFSFFVCCIVFYVVCYEVVKRKFIVCNYKIDIMVGFFIMVVI